MSIRRSQSAKSSKSNDSLDIVSRIFDESSLSPDSIYLILLDLDFNLSVFWVNSKTTYKQVAAFLKTTYLYNEHGQQVFDKVNNKDRPLMNSKDESTSPRFFFSATKIVPDN